MFIDLSLQFREDDEAFTHMKSDPKKLFQSGHFGTHLDVHLKTKVPLDVMQTTGVLFDVSMVHGRDIELTDFEGSLIKEKDFVIFKTDMIKRHAYGTKPYFIDHPQLSQAVLDYLVNKKVAFIGIDAAGVRRAGEHVIADKFCEEAGVYIIENLTNLDQLEKHSHDGFSVNTSWIEIPGQTGLPCRVVAKVC